MIIWITGDITLTKPLAFEQDKNVIIVGTISSNSDISFKVNNLVVFGKIISTKNINIKTKEDFFNSGSIKADNNISILSGDSIYNGLNDLAIEKIRALGVDLSKTPGGGLTVRILQ